MIILDTNIISELMRIEPEKKVSGWVDSILVSNLGITSITVSEILYGIGLLPPGKKSRRLFEIAGILFESDFTGRIFSFDQSAAVDYAKIVIQREKIGNPISMADAQIASICRSKDFILATRNTRDFINTGIQLIDPWSL